MQHFSVLHMVLLYGVLTSQPKWVLAFLVMQAFGLLLWLVYMLANIGYAVMFLSNGKVGPGVKVISLGEETDIPAREIMTCW